MSQNHIEALQDVHSKRLIKQLNNQRSPRFQ